MLCVHVLFGTVRFIFTTHVTGLNRCLSTSKCTLTTSDEDDGLFCRKLVTLTFELYFTASLHQNNVTSFLCLPFAQSWQ